MASTEPQIQASAQDSAAESAAPTAAQHVSPSSAALGTSDLPPGTHLETPVDAQTPPASVPAVAATEVSPAPAATSEPATVPPQPQQTSDGTLESKEAEGTEQIKNPMERQMSTAIGSPMEESDSQVQDTKSPGITLAITLLLTNGARHPYKIDERYLKKRNVNPPDMDPFNISVYTLKELILREWREEWEPKPTSPSAIRLIHFGRLLDDKQPLKECRLQADSPNVIHMTVRPQEVIDEEDAKTAKGVGRERDGAESSPGCRCVIL